MNIARPFKSAELDQSEEIDVEGNIRELVSRDGGALRQADDDSELSADSLSNLLGRVSLSSTREIDNLIGELRGLREKLQAEGNRVQRDIVEYASLSQSVMQLTKIISEGVTQVKKPEAPNTRWPEHKLPFGVPRES